jgi:hypothetical protein
LFGTINGYDGAMYELKPGSFVVCTNRYRGAYGDQEINKVTGFSDFVAVSSSFDGFKPSGNTKIQKEQPQKTDVIKITIIEFETFEKVNQNF